jgi:hypothetical protein
VKFSSAGLATIPQGKTHVTISPGLDITPETKVLATLQSAGGTLSRVGRNFAADTIRFSLTGPAAQPVIVAYLIIS